ncbi:MAG: hypothetical protein FJ291_24685 [Planctomycetes bacterium]|nr:hypothetical protein [Planctomycetota bacterium]
MDERLLNASINDLAAFLRGRFQMRGPWAADTGAPAGEFPYDLPLEVWKEADANMRRNLVQATQILLGEIPGPEWSAEAIEWFVAFIDLADMQEVRAALAEAAETGRWLDCADDAPACHTVLLRTLLDMGWGASRRFWLHLPEEVQQRYPALAFRGLLADGAANSAFWYLSKVARDRETARQIVNVLAGVMDDAKTRCEVRRQFSRCLPELPPEVAAELRKWFRIHRWGTILSQRRPVEEPEASKADHVVPITHRVSPARALQIAGVTILHIAVLALVLLLVPVANFVWLCVVRPLLLLDRAFKRFEEFSVSATEQLISPLALRQGINTAGQVIRRLWLVVRVLMALVALVGAVSVPVLLACRFLHVDVLRPILVALVGLDVPRLILIALVVTVVVCKCLGFLFAATGALIRRMDQWRMRAANQLTGRLHGAPIGAPLPVIGRSPRRL